MTDPLSLLVSGAPAPRLPDVNAQTCPFDLVAMLLDQAAYFNMVATPIPENLHQVDPVPRDPAAARGVAAGCGLEIRAWLHRLDASLPPGAADFEVSQTVGPSAGNYSGRWMFCPADFPWSPGQEPPPQAFEPWSPQRFVMLDGRVRFATGDGFEGYGVGQTFPITVNGQPRLLAGAVGNLMRGHGKLEGLAATFVFNGVLSPSRGFQGNVSCRVIDPEGRLRSDRDLPPPRSFPEPDPDVTYLVLRGAKKDSSVLTTYGPPPDDQRVSLITPAQMRSADYRFSTREYLGLKTRLSIGQVVGRLQATVDLDILAPPGTAEKPAPF